MSDTDTMVQALAQLIEQVGRLDERGLASAPPEAPLAETRETFERLDRLGALPTIERPRVDDEAPPEGRQVTREQICAALRPFVELYRELSADDQISGDDLAMAEVMVSDLERAADVYRALGAHEQR